VRCSALQCVAVCCSVLQCGLTWIMSRIARAVRDVIHIHTHCNTLQHIATHCIKSLYYEMSHEHICAELISHMAYVMTRAGAVFKCSNGYTHNIGPWHVYTKRITRRHKISHITRTCNLSHFIRTYGINHTHTLHTENILTSHPIPSHPHMAPLIHRGGRLSWDVCNKVSLLRHTLVHTLLHVCTKVSLYGVMCDLIRM